MMIRSCSSVFFWLGMTIGASLMLYHTSDRVTALDRRLYKLNKEIESEETSLHVLKAEWVYLANPARIEAQAYKHLNMQPTELHRVVAAQDMSRILPINGEVIPQIAKADQEAAPLQEAHRRLPESPSLKPAFGTKPDRVVATLNEGHINEHMTMQHSGVEASIRADSSPHASDIAGVARALAGATGSTTDGIGAFIGTMGLSQ